MKNTFTLKSFFSRFLLIILILSGVISETYAQQFQRVYANDVQKSDDDYLLGLIRAGWVENEGLAADNNTSTRSTLYSTAVNVLGIPIGGKAVLRLRFTGADKPLPNTPVTIKLGVGGNVLSAINAITVQAINGPANNLGNGNGNEVGPVYSGTQVVNLLSGQNQIEFTITPAQAYDGVKISLGIPQGILNAGVLTNLDVHHAYILKPASSIVCETVIDSLYGSTGILAGGLNAVSDPSLAFDKNESTYATLRTNVSALSTTFLTGVYPSLSQAGDSVRLILQADNTGLLDATLLSSLMVRTYNGTTQRQSFILNSPLLSVQLLGGSGNRYRVSIPTTQTFNRIQVSIGNGVLGALAGLRVIEMGRAAPTPVIENPGLAGGVLTACEGAPINFTIQNPEAGATYRWFDAPTGGTEITTGVSNNGASFSPTGLAAGTYEFYVALYRNGCTDPVSDRAKVTVIVTPASTAADIDAAGDNVCLGSPATLPAPALSGTSTIANPVFRYYLDANRTTPITNGTVGGVTYALNPDGSISVTGLTATRDYYVSVSGDGICETAAGNLKTVTVTVNNIVQPTVDLSGNQFVGTGGTITFTASSSNADSYQWYKDNVAIPGATANTYTITGATAGDAGIYTVIAIGGGALNCSSPASDAITLSVGGFGSTKTVSGLNAQGTIDAGSELTYTITVTNTGSMALAGITISDVIPTGTTYVANSADNGGTLAGNTLNWTIGVAPSGSTAVSFRVLVDSDLTSIPSIGNTATVDDPSDAETPQTPTVPPIPTNRTSSFSSTKTLVSGLNANNKISAGATLTYNIVITNTGNTLLDDVTVSDAIPAGTSFVSADNGGTETAGTVNWTVDVPVGGSTTLALAVKVADNLTGIASIANAATVTNPGDPTNPQTPSTPPTDTDPVRDFTATKTLVAGLNANNKISAGAELTYNITVTNTGTTDLTGVTISDPIPAGTTFVSADNGGTESNGVANWTINVPFGGSTVVELKVRVIDDLTGITSIANAATVTDPTDPTNPENPTTPPTDTDPVRDFTATKTLVAGLNANNKISAGAELTYNITVNNTGTTTLTGITISDVIPTGTTFVSANNGGTLTGNTANWTIDVPFGGSTVVELKVKVADDLTGITSIANAATVTDPTDPTNPENPTTPPTDTDPVRDFTATKTLVAGLNANNKISAGAELTYNITVNNTGTTTLTGITISDVIPTGTTFVSANNGGTLTGNTANWTIDVPFGGSTVVELKVRVADDLTGITSIANAATVTDPTDPTNPENPTTPPTDTDPVRDFTATKTLVAGLNANNKISAGAELTYNITVNNTGTTTLTGITISDVIPTGTTFVSANNGGTLTGNTANWTIDVPFGGSTVVELKVRVADDLTGITSIANAATVTDPTDPTNPENPTTPPTDTDPVRDFTATKTLVAGLNANNKISAGAELTYNITVNNTGTTTLTGITISDVIPTGTTFVSANNGGTLTGNTANWTVDVPFGGSTVVELKVRVADDLTGITSIANAATVTDPTDPTNPENPTTPPTDTDPVYDFSLSSSITSNSPDGKANPGGELTVTVNVTNTGNAPLTSVDVSSMLPNNTTFLSANNNGTFDAGAGEINFDIPTIAVGATSSVSFKVTVDMNLALVPTINSSSEITAQGVTKTVSASIDVTCPTRTVTDLLVNGQAGGDLCINTSGTVNITATSTGIVTPLYYLYQNNNLVTTSLTGTFTVNVVAGNSYTYTVGVSGIGFCETAAADRRPITFTVNQIPGAPGVTSNSVATCEGTGAVLSVASPQTGFVYNWYDAATGGNQVGSGVSFTTPNLSANTNYFVEAVSASLCNSTSRTQVSVTINASPAAPVSATVTNGPICVGTPAVLSVDNPQAGTIYRWYTSLTGGTPLAEGNIYTTGNITMNTIFYVESVSSATGCASNTRTAVNVTVIPVLDIPVVSVDTKTMNSITFKWNAITGAASYEVSTDGGLTWSPSNGTTTHLIAGLNAGQSVTISVRALGASACQNSPASTPFTDTTSNPFGDGVYIPNAFTPNNDGNNDRFEIYGNTISRIKLKVFNQWGQLIFESSSQNPGWDGTYKGELQPTGVYVYTAEIAFLNGTTTSKKGTVTLLR